MARTSKQMERYNRLKEQGICVRCGKRENDGTLLCEECHAKIREYYLKYRHTMSDYQYQKQRETSLRWQRNNREYYNEYNKRWRESQGDRYRAYQREYKRKYYRLHREEILAKLREQRKERNNGETE